MAYVCQVVGLFQTPELHTIHDGQYLVQYDQGTGQMDWTITTSPDMTRAIQYPDTQSIQNLRYATPADYPWRVVWMPTSPNAPLWRYTLSAVAVA